MTLDTGDPICSTIILRLSGFTGTRAITTRLTPQAHVEGAPGSHPWSFPMDTLTSIIGALGTLLSGVKLGLTAFLSL